MVDAIEKLYASCSVLTDAKDKMKEHEKEYLEIISAAKNGEGASVKKLASQLIGRFFKHFPEHHSTALDAIFDLCEDDDVNIRKQSIKDLPNLCRDNKENTFRIADILAQLLQSDDHQEQSITSNSLVTIIQTDPINALKGIFQQLLIGEDLLRERCFKFLLAKLKVIGRDIINKEVDDVIIEQCRKLIQSVNGEDFKTTIQILTNTHLVKTVTGQKELVTLIEKHASLDQPFTVEDEDHQRLHLVTLCASSALPFYSSQINSNTFLRYYCEEILPRLEEIENIENGRAIKMVVLRHLAEMAAYSTSYENIEKSVSQIHECLKTYMPMPPEDGDVTNYPKQEYSYVECLLYALHKLGRHCPTFLSDESRLHELKLRIQYFARGLQGSIKTLNEKMAADDDLKKQRDPNLLLHIMTNINTLIKDLFRAPPIYKAKVTLSWKEPESVRKIPSSPIENNSQPVMKPKRHAQITFDGGPSPAKQSRGNGKTSGSEQQKIYTPPSGKYSNKVSGYDGARRGRGGGRPSRGRNNYRGTNRGWRY